MGILRTDKISGLETPTAITSSVYFDGDARNDNLNMAADYHDLDFQNTDFTFESWVYPTDMSVDRYWCSKGNGNLPGTAMDVRFDSDGQIRISFYVSSTSHQVLTSSGVLQENVWSHVAVVRSGTSFKCYVNGIETASATHDITISDVSATFKIGILEGVGTGFKGYMSDFRFVRGKAVYTEEFTPPVYALEPIDGTVLLCCNNPDSAAAVSLAGIGTSKIIVVNGDVSIASTNPGSLKDFTYGTEFKGVTTFDTQGYFVPPSGTTEQRGRGRGVFAGGVNPGTVNTISYLTLSSGGNTKDFGDLTSALQSLRGGSSTTRGLFTHSASSPVLQNIDFVTIASEGNALDFGDTAGTSSTGCTGSNNTRSVFWEGTVPSTGVQISYVTTASLGTAAVFGDMFIGVRHTDTMNSPTRCIVAGGWIHPAGNTNVIQYITFATTGDALEFGDVTGTVNGIRANASTSSSTRGVYAGGANTPGNVAVNTIEYLTLATFGNTQDFGDLSVAKRTEGGGTSNGIRGVFAGGYTVPGNTAVNTMDYVNIASTGDAMDFGDLSNQSRYVGACSDSHGGLS